MAQSHTLNDFSHTCGFVCMCACMYMFRQIINYEFLLAFMFNLSCVYSYKCYYLQGYVLNNNYPML